MGTDNSLQKLVNVYVQPLALYQHTFSQSWNATVYASAPVQIYKINNSKRRSKAYINGGFSVNGWIGRASMHSCRR